MSVIPETVPQVPAAGWGRRAARKAVAWLSRVLPKGNTLPVENWLRRHRVIVFVLWAHVLALPGFGMVNDHGVRHSILEAAIVSVFAIGATLQRLGNPARAVCATIGLVSSSAILTHFSGGLIEMHFHFFVVVAIVTLYQSWLPFAIAITYVLLHHGFVGATDAAAVYNHASAIASPWKWALVHAAFIAGESAACLTAWKLNEDALQAERNVRVALEKANQDIEYNAFHDPLTGLSNRALFLDRASHALTTRRSAGLVSTLFVDLDDFKTLNDSLGAAVGDELLVEVAARLENVIRPSDTVARLGNDEFAVLLEHADVRIARQVAGRIQEVLRPPLAAAGQHVMIHASIGIGVSDENSTPESLLQDADIAMSAVKSSGKNGVDACDAEMRVGVVRRQQLKAELGGAIERGEFLLHFQPIVDLPSRAPVGAEALVRWDHPQWGLVPPPEFIGLAEESGLIVPLGEWILEEATRRGVGLRAAGGEDFTIAVNLSVAQLREPGIVAAVKTSLERSGFPPENLVLEITETVLAGENESTVAALHDLRSLGIKIAIDDFGTGYSTLSYLYRFPLDILKIDREFVSTLTNGPDELAVVQTLMELASVLKLRTVAEGIETQEQLSALEALGCLNGQGYLFSRPLAPEHLNNWLHEEAGAKAVA